MALHKSVCRCVDGFAVRCEAVALPRRNKCWMICGCAAGAGFVLILAEPKAGPGAEPMLRVTLPAGQSHRLTSSGKAEFNIAYDFLCKAIYNHQSSISFSAYIRIVPDPKSPRFADPVFRVINSNSWSFGYP